MCAPIILFVYNRIEHTKRALEALSKCNMAEQSVLYIYSDGAKSGDEYEVARVREYIHCIDGFKEVNIIEREKNYGIELSEVSAITEILGNYSSAIMLEDDLVVARTFLQYMNDALEKYQSEKQVFFISGYSYLKVRHDELPECMFLQMPSTWGWATWADRWQLFQSVPDGVDKIIYNKKQIKKFNYDGAVTAWGTLLTEQYRMGKYTWDIAWGATVFKHDGLALLPNQSQVMNIGLDGSGTHREMRKGQQNNFENSGCNISQWPEQIEESKKIRRRVGKILKQQSLYEKYNNKIDQIKQMLHYFRREK